MAEESSEIVPLGAPLSMGSLFSTTSNDTLLFVSNSIRAGAYETDQALTFPVSANVNQALARRPVDLVAFLRHPPTRSATTTGFSLTMKYQIR
jgi:hypothetical protein